MLKAGMSAVVTGAGRGIGQAIATRLCAGGVKVLFVARTKEAVEAAARAAGSNAASFAADITAADGPQRIVDAALARFGDFNVFINTASRITQEPLEELDLADLDAMYAVNLRGSAAMAKAVMPTLKRSRGQIVFMNSVVVRSTDIGGRGGFAAIQCGVKAIADSLRAEVNPFGVRVISVFPGSTAGPRQVELHALKDMPYRPELLIQASDIAEMVFQALALPMTVEVTDVYMRPMRKR